MQTTITAENIETIRQQLPIDQARELEIGCVTWPVAHDAGTGAMTTWPNGRAALCLGADSTWGEWDGSRLITDAPGEIPTAFDADGREIAWFTRLQQLRAAGWTNRQIAAACGLSTHTVDQWFFSTANASTPSAAAQKLLEMAVASLQP